MTNVLENEPFDRALRSFMRSGDAASRAVQERKQRKTLVARVVAWGGDVTCRCNDLSWR